MISLCKRYRRYSRPLIRISYKTSPFALVNIFTNAGSHQMLVTALETLLQTRTCL